MFVLTTTTSMLPPTSSNVPYVTRYISFLTGISILSVLATVISVVAHHFREIQEKQQNYFHKVISRIKQEIWRNPVTNLNRHVTIEDVDVQNIDYNQNDDIEDLPVLSSNNLPFKDNRIIDNAENKRPDDLIDNSSNGEKSSTCLRKKTLESKNYNVTSPNSNTVFKDISLKKNVFCKYIDTIFFFIFLFVWVITSSICFAIWFG